MYRYYTYMYRYYTYIYIFIILLFYLIIYKFMIDYLLLIKQVAATLRMNWATNSSSLLMSAGTH